MKALKIILLIVLVIGVIAIIGGLIAVISGNLSYRLFYSANSVVISDERFDADEVDTISIHVASTDVMFNRSEDEDFRVVYNGPSNEASDPLITVSHEDDAIMVNQHNQFMPAFFGVHRVVTVYIPQSFSGSVDFKCASGDLELTDDFIFDEFRYRVSSGDMKCKSLSAGKATFETASGDFICGVVDADEYTIQTASGDIEIKKLVGDGTIKVASGDINIDEYIGAGYISSSSGRVKVFLREATGDISIRVVSGSVNVIVPEEMALLLDFSVTSGDIDTDIALNNAHVSRNKTTGTIGEAPEYNLEVRTTSGDIRISNS